MRHAGLLELRREVFGEHTANKSPASVTDDERADPAVGFAQRNQPVAEAFEDGRGKLSPLHRQAGCGGLRRRRKARRPSRVGPCASSRGGAHAAVGRIGDGSRSSARVSCVPGASGSVVKARAPAESSPRRTRDVARRARGGIAGGVGAAGATAAAASRIEGFAASVELFGRHAHLTRRAI